MLNSLESVAVAIFDYFDLRSLIKLGLVCQSFYFYCGKRSLLPKFKREENLPVVKYNTDQANARPL